MERTLRRHLIFLLAAAALHVGCAFRNRPEVDFGPPDLGHFQQFATAIEYPDAACETCDDFAQTPPPLTLSESDPPPFRDLTLQETVATALSSSEVLRDMQGTVLKWPERLNTVQGPAIRDTDPIVGVEAALSAFDATFESRAFFEKNDRALNNVFFGGGTRLLTQDLHAYSAGITKRTAVGTNFALRHNVFYDFNNQPGNDVPNRPWDVNLEGEVRQPLLQGAGAEFNRIAGPNGAPGRFHGVMLGRLNTDVSLTEFEIGVNDFVTAVEDAYWQLCYAYRDLDAKRAARDRALETWRRIHALYVNGRRGGEAEKEAQAREQYFRLHQEVENSLAGRIVADGQPGGPGVQQTERQLRRLMGVPINDGTLLRPVDELMMAKVVFDWNEVLVEALSRRAELRQQQWRIKSAELRLAATKNFLLPRLDAVGRYRWRGLGHDLLDPNGDATDRFDNAYGNMTGGDFQEWQLGIECTTPLGFRQGHVAVRNAELNLARERAVLEEQKRQIVHDLSGEFADVERAYIVSQTNYNRRLAARDQLGALEAVYEDADENEKTRLLDLLLDAQRRLADAESQYYRSLMEYTLAIKDVHYQKGSLLDYNEILLAEGPWPGKAYLDACRRQRLRSAPLDLSDYRMTRGPVVSQGPYPQDTGASEPEAVTPMPAASEPHRESDPAPQPTPAPTVPGQAPLTDSAAASWTRPRRLPRLPDQEPRYEGLTTGYSAAPDRGPAARATGSE
ncbi:MAG: TolC family protein [Pirellulaceae bacterium]|jgi:outer membrane protein TolC|nr:TolC family protein [Pirellulaceae bacterium]